MKNVYVLERNHRYPALGNWWTAVCLDDDDIVTLGSSMGDLIQMLSRYFVDLHEDDKRLTITVEAGE